MKGPFTVTLDLGSPFDLEGEPARIHPPVDPRPAAAVAPTPSGDGAAPWPTGEGWRPLFDGKSLDGWRVVADAEFARHGPVRAADGRLILQAGNHRTGIACTAPLPAEDYEIALEATREAGGSDFCNLVFPVGDAYAALTMGGYGTLTGLDQVDGQPFNRNATTRTVRYQRRQWYRVLLRVTKTRVQASVGGETIIDVPRDGHTFTLRESYAPLKPLGISTWNTTSGIRNVQIRRIRGESGPIDGTPPTGG